MAIADGSMTWNALRMYGGNILAVLVMQDSDLVSTLLMCSENI